MIGGAKMCSFTGNKKELATSFNKLELKCDKGQSKSTPDSKKPKYNDAQKLQVKKHFCFKNANELIDQCNDLIEFNKLSDQKDRSGQDFIIPTHYLEKYKDAFDVMRTCSGRIEVKDGEISKVFRCKNKLCPICSGIKQGKLINRYSKFFELYKDDIYLVTLTFKNVKAKYLNKACHDQKDMFSCIRRTINRRLKRSGLSNMKGILKLEITYNQKDDEYHPHLHLVVVGKDLAHSIPDLWMRKADQYGYLTDHKAQDVTKCTSAKELFKYVTKLSYTTDKDQYLQKVLLRPLLNIYHSLSGTSEQKAVRVISHFGVSTKELDLTKEYAEKIAPVVDQLDDDDQDDQDVSGGVPVDVFDWNLRMNDYYSMKTGRLYGGLKLKDWNDNRFDRVKHSDMFDIEVKDLIRGKGAIFDQDKSIDNVFRDGKTYKYWDDFRPDDQKEKYPYCFNLVAYKIPVNETD